MAQSELESRRSERCAVSRRSATRSCGRSLVAGRGRCPAYDLSIATNPACSKWWSPVKAAVSSRSSITRNNNNGRIGLQLLNQLNKHFLITRPGESVRKFDEYVFCGDDLSPEGTGRFDSSSMQLVTLVYEADVECGVLGSLLSKRILPTDHTDEGKMVAVSGPFAPSGLAPRRRCEQGFGKGSAPAIRLQVEYRHKLRVGFRHGEAWRGLLIRSCRCYVSRGFLGVSPTSGRGPLV